MEFADLVFEPHPAKLGGTHAKHGFDNGFGVSVITGSLFYTSAEGPYEVGILHNDKLTYDTDITDDVLGYQTEADVTAILARVEALPTSP